MFTKKLFYILLSFFVLFLSFAAHVKADTDLSITGNGGSSSNQVNVTNSSQTTVQQSNTASVNNSVNTTQNTGNNSVSNNSDSTSISTGNTSAQTSVNTTANSSTVDTGCNCNNTSSTSISVSANGDGSQNTAEYRNRSQITSVVSNNTTVTNTISETANTGSNQGTDNIGSVSIHTGDINVHNSITNSTNDASVKESTAGSNEITIDISGNGPGSVNSVNLSDGSKITPIVTNNSDISNVLNSHLNTGGNVANRDNGVVDIVTGNILFSTEINNTVNTSTLEESSCKKDPSDNSTTPSNPSVPGSSANPSTPASGSASAGSSSASSSPSGFSQAATASMGDSLPVTGAHWFLFIVIGNVLMFFLGAYLRLRSGRSPGVTSGF